MRRLIALASMALATPATAAWRQAETRHFVIVVLEPLAYAPHASSSQATAKAMLDGLTARFKTAPSKTAKPKPVAPAKS